MSHSGFTRFVRCCVALACAGAAMSSVAQRTDCGPIANAYGPFDYRTSKDRLPIVENNHFTPEVEALIRGKSGYIDGDIDYTLRVFPNHHRALVSMMRLGERMHLDKTPNAVYPVECYFDRALRFQPDDTVARMLYVTYLNKRHRDTEATQQMAEVVRRAADDPFAHYNAGLVYVDMKNYPLALQEAYRAQALGFTRTELHDQLAAVGKWVEPTPADLVSAAAAVAPASPASAAASAAAPAASAP